MTLQKSIYSVLSLFLALLGFERLPFAQEANNSSPTLNTFNNQAPDRQPFITRETAREYSNLVLIDAKELHVNNTRYQVTTDSGSVLEIVSKKEHIPSQYVLYREIPRPYTSHGVPMQFFRDELGYSKDRSKYTSYASKGLYQEYTSYARLYTSYNVNPDYELERDFIMRSGYNLQTTTGDPIGTIFQIYNGTLPQRECVAAQVNEVTAALSDKPELLSFLTRKKAEDIHSSVHHYRGNLVTVDFTDFSEGSTKDIQPETGCTLEGCEFRVFSYIDENGHCQISTAETIVKIVTEWKLADKNGKNRNESLHNAIRQLANSLQKLEDVPDTENEEASKPH